MPTFDLNVEELRAYHADVELPGDFDAFWSETLTEARKVPMQVTSVAVPTPMRMIECLDVSFPGFGGHPVRAWLTKPRGVEGQLPAVVEFIGYGGGRGLPHEHLRWACSGYVGLIVDTRGQGAAWGAGGGTPDPIGSDPSSPGFLTRGVLDPATYYYRRVFTDAVRAVEAIRTFEDVDASRVAVVGTSQGGGITLAVGGLVPDLVAIAPNVPFLCNFRRASEISPADPYKELVRYLSVYRDATETVFRTLNYFDGVNFARRATAPALFATALMDEICPPSTVFAAYNEYRGPKEIEVYPYNGHDGGGPYFALRQHEFVNAHMGLAD